MPVDGSDRPVLGRCVGDVGRFLDRHLHRSPLHQRCSSAGSFDDLLSLADVDELLTAGGLRPPSIRLVHDGNPVASRLWTRRARTGGTVVDDLVDPAKVLAQYDAGATVVLQSMHRWWPPLGRFCRDLAGELGHPVQANAYLTPPGARGFTPHHDTHDVFVLQLHGRKAWTLRTPLRELPFRHERSRAEAAGAQPPQAHIDLLPGECLYLPRGVIHEAETQHGASLHLTIGVLAATRLDLARDLLSSLAAGSQVLREATSPRSDREPDIARAEIDLVVTELRRLLDELSPDEIDELAHRRTDGRPPPAHDLSGQLLALDRLDDLDGETTVIARRGLDPLFTCSEQHLVVRVHDRTIELPAGLQTVVRVLLDGSPHRTADLDHLIDGPSALVLVRRLVREGLVVPLDDAARPVRRPT